MRAAFSDGDMYTLRPSEDDVNRVVIATLERTGGSNDQVHAGLLAHVRKWLSDIPDQACDPLELKQMAHQEAAWSANGTNGKRCNTIVAQHQRTLNHHL